MPISVVVPMIVGHPIPPFLISHALSVPLPHLARLRRRLAFMGIVYISVVWHLASVVSMLEDMYEFAAMQKSKLLIKGKALIASAIFLMINTAEMVVHVLFAALVVRGGKLGAGARVGYALLFLALLSVLTLLGLLLQTIIYFV